VTWGRAAQRAAIAATARAARSEAGLQEPSGEQHAIDAAQVLGGALRVAREVVLRGNGIDHDYCHAVQIEGVPEGAYIEVVGVVSTLVNLNGFARALGLHLRAIGAASDASKPSFERPTEEVDEGFFTASARLRRPAVR